MSLDDLVKKRLIKPFKVSKQQSLDRLKIARRDITTAKQLLGSDTDWAFSIAYNAILQAARALMFSMGYRPSAGEGQHVAAVHFAEEVLGKEMGDEIFIFDKMRTKRHRAIYDVTGSISLQEAKDAFEFAVHFVDSVSAHLEK